MALVVLNTDREKQSKEGTGRGGGGGGDSSMVPISFTEDTPPELNSRYQVIQRIGRGPRLDRLHFLCCTSSQNDRPN